MDPTSEDLSKIHVCTQLVSSSTDRDGGLPTGNLIPSDGDSGPAKLAMPTGTFWRNGTRLRVSMWGGSSFVQSKIRQYASGWENHANIDFRFVGEKEEADIRITFDPKRGSNSYVGTDNMQIPKDQPTMNFGWFNDQTADEEFSRTVLHEFGHALGCVHEQASPDIIIPWNKPVVYAYYKRTQDPPWTEADVDQNVFEHYTAKEAKHSKFDPKSIMTYRIPPEFTDGKLTIPSNSVLSATDKVFIRQMYPPQTRDTGAFSTTEQRDWNQPVASNLKQVKFEPAYKEPPNIAVGLNELDMSKDQNIRVTAYADRISNDSFVVHTDTWADSTLYSAGATWLEVSGNNAQDFQVGEVSTKQPHSNELLKSKRIDFEHAYETSPKIVVWLKAVDLAKDRGWRVNAWASDIDKDGFTIHIDTWADTIMYSAAASWIAYPEDKHGVWSGSADTSYRGLTPQLQNGGDISFPKDTFDRPPRSVLIAVNRLDFGNGANLRFRAFADSVSKNGFVWQVNCWADTVCYGAAISYVAFA